MSFEPLPPNIEQGVQQFASELHISHDEAVLKLIESGLNASKPPRKRLRPKKGPQPPVRTDNPESIIGLFADRPDIVDSILEVVESRNERYSDLS